MKVSLQALREGDGEFDLTILSLELALYQVQVESGGERMTLCDDSGRPLRFRTLQAARELLAGLPTRSLCLEQRSAYDEMVGQPLREHNRMRVPLEPLEPDSEGPGA